MLLPRAADYCRREVPDLVKGRGEQPFRATIRELSARVTEFFPVFRALFRVSAETAEAAELI